MDKINVAVIGLGHWGPNILNSFREDDRVGRIIGIDLNEERKKVIQGKCPWAELNLSLDQVLADEDISCITIATPTESHFNLGMKALDANKHLLIEKPIAHNSEAAAELMKKAKEKNLIIMTGHVFLFNDAIVKLKEIIDSGEIGEVLYVRSVRSNLGPIREDVNALWDLATHDISIFDYLFNSNPVQASSLSFSPLGLKQADISIGALTYSNNRSASFFVSWLDPAKTRQLTVVGDKKMVVFDDMRPMEPLTVFDQGVKLMPKTEYSDSFHSFFASIHKGEAEKINVTTGQPLKNECQHFVDCVIKEEQPKTDAENGLRVVKILEALQESSSKHGSPVNLWSN